ncbi:MAG TPA: serine hydrolase [Candidatus Saccharimonadales bacterium]|nr:serine hydrolase [Candidatus Saccharimonadales bacterium]
MRQLLQITGKVTFIAILSVMFNLVTLSGMAGAAPTGGGDNGTSPYYNTNTPEVYGGYPWYALPCFSSTAGNTTSTLQINSQAAQALAKKLSTGSVNIGYAMYDSSGNLVSNYNDTFENYGASITKSMILVAYLTQVANGTLNPNTTESDGISLAANADAMIHISDDNDANVVYHALKNPSQSIQNVASQAGMTGFKFNDSADTLYDLGQSQITANDFAKFFSKIDTMIPSSQQQTGLDLLANVSPVTGILQAGIPGTVYSKEGWKGESSSNTGISTQTNPYGAEGVPYIVNQAAQFQSNGTTYGLAFTTAGVADEGTGELDILDITKALLTPSQSGTPGTPTTTPSPTGSSGGITLTGVPQAWQPLFIDAGEKFNVPPIWLAAIFYTENGNNWAGSPTSTNWPTSPTGAQGPMQFEPGSWSAYGTVASGTGLPARPSSVGNSPDINWPPDAVFAAAKYGSQGLGLSGTAAPGDLNQAFIAHTMIYAAGGYNAGYGTMIQATKQFGANAPVDDLTKLGAGYSQTVAYMKNVYALVTSKFSQSGQGPGGSNSPCSSSTGVTVSNSNIVNVALQQDVAWNSNPGSDHSLFVKYTANQSYLIGEWCAAFVSWVYMTAGVPLSGGGGPSWLIGSAFGIMRYMQTHGIWTANGANAAAPQPGDVVVFCFQGSTCGTSTSFESHIGIVDQVVGNDLYTIEGNAGLNASTAGLAPGCKAFAGNIASAPLGVGCSVYPGYQHLSSIVGWGGLK